MNKRVILGCLTVILLTLIIFSTSGFSGVEKNKVLAEKEFKIVWSHAYGGTGFDEGFSIIQTIDGGYLVAGSLELPGGIYREDIYDLWLVKTNSLGEMEWNKTFDGGLYEGSNSIIPTTDGGFAIAGGTGDAIDRDMWLIKINASGYEEWNRTYSGGVKADFAKSIIQTVDGGYALAGYTTLFGSSEPDMWLVKTNVSGYEEWNKSYGGSEHEMIKSLLQTTDEGFLLAGETNSYGAGNGDIWLVKTNASGYEEWNKTFGGIYIEYSAQEGLVNTSDGGFVFAGVTASYGPGSGDMWLIKTNASGYEEWNKTYGGSEIDGVHSMIQTSDGGFLLTGVTFSFGVGGDLWVVKTNADGQMEMNGTFGGPDTDYALSVIQTADGYVFTGMTSSYGAGDYDMWILKIIESEIIDTTTTTTIPTTTPTTTTTTTDVSPGFEYTTLVLSLIILYFSYKRKQKS